MTLVEAIRKTGLSITEAAERLGCSRRHIYFISRGESKASQDIIKGLKGIGVDTEAVFTSSTVTMFSAKGVRP